MARRRMFASEYGTSPTAHAMPSSSMALPVDDGEATARKPLPPSLDDQAAPIEGDPMQAFMRFLQTFGGTQS